MQSCELMVPVNVHMLERHGRLGVTIVGITGALEPLQSLLATPSEHEIIVASLIAALT